MSESAAVSNPEAELPLLSAPRAQVHFVSSPEELVPVIQSLNESQGAVAIDAERASGFKYSQRAYLIQLKAKDGPIFLIDPTSNPDIATSIQFAELKKVLGDREWILHAATQDLPCLAELGLQPGAIFDTELASRLAGQARVGLGSLTENLLGYRLAKEHSAADWSTRPLPKEWLNYAALDVDVLHELAQAVLNLLIEQNKSEWAKEEFESLLGFKPKVQRVDKWRGITGLHKVQDRMSLEIARCLWVARESLAQKMDIAAGRLIPDSSILAAAMEKPKSRPELAAMKSFSGRASRSYLDHWWEAVSSALRANELPAIKPEKTDALPNHRNWINKFPDADRRLKFAKEKLGALCEELNLPLENLLTPEYLRQICFTPPQPISVQSIANRLLELGARKWQVKNTAEVIAAEFNRAETVQDDQPAADLQEQDEHGEL